MKSEKSVIDFEQLHQLSGQDPEFELELLQLFIEDSVNQLKTLKTAIVNQDAESIRNIAHYLKGASANLGANLVYHSAFKLEGAAREHQLENVESLFVELKTGLNQVQDYLSDQVSES
ncbi:MAG: Hpt domain-containing protein [Pseudanabaenales cyanobacterium]|nr:Hpt domain-containing protein [Pseudanabaenales cyanobacterium]